MRWGLAEGSLARSKWWRRVVDAVGVEVAEVVVVVVVVVKNGGGLSVGDCKGEMGFEN